MMNDWRKHLTSRRHENGMMDKGEEKRLEAPKDLRRRRRERFSVGRPVCWHVAVDGFRKGMKRLGCWKKF